MITRDGMFVANRAGSGQFLLAFAACKGLGLGLGLGLLPFSACEGLGLGLLPFSACEGFGLGLRLLLVFSACEGPLSPHKRDNLVSNLTLKVTLTLPAGLPQDAPPMRPIVPSPALGHGW